MKKYIITTLAVVYILTAIAQPSGRCISETAELRRGLGKVSFLTTQTWQVGNQVWSDVITATRCQKETFSGLSSGEYNVDCRNTPESGTLFSWCAVQQFQRQLCPRPWRVPTDIDFIELNKALGGEGHVFNDDPRRMFGQETQEVFDGYQNVWGMSLAGFSTQTGRHNLMGVMAYYWSTSTFDDAFGSAMIVSGRNQIVNIQFPVSRAQGHSVRCVR